MISPALQSNIDMRTLLALFCVVTVALAVAVVGLYLRTPSTPPDPTIREVAVSSAPSVTSPPVVNGNEWREAVEKLNRRLDQISGELESLRQAREREPVAPVHVPTEEEYRALHERTILSIVADERSRVAFEATCDAIRSRVKDWCQENNESNERSTAIVDVLLEGQRRKELILRRFAPDGKWPVPGDSARNDWEKAWRELRGWRDAQLARSIDATQAEQLLGSLQPLLQY
jgi:hypothetical protein